MPRRKNVDKGKDSLELLGIKIDPALKRSIEDEGNALGVPMSTYARQLLIIGWQARHNAPISKNPRESILIGWFNELPIDEQENVLLITEALHRKHATAHAPTLPAPDNTPTQIPASELLKTIANGAPVKASRTGRPSRKGGRK